MIPLLVRRRASPRSEDLEARPLRLVVDPKSLGASEELEFLLTFMGRGHVEVWSTDPDASFYVAAEMTNASGATFEFRATSPHEKRSGVIPNVPSAIAQAPRLEAAGLGGEAGLRRKLLNVALAGAFGADALVADMPVQELRRAGIRQVQTQNILSASEALALIGLVLRTSLNEVPIPLGPGEWRHSRGNFYWDGVRLRLPSWDAWHGEPIQSGDWAAAESSQATLIRMAHALRARDHCHAEWQLSRNPHSDEGLYHLDMYLVSSMGALDAAARVISRRLGYQGEDRDIGWQRAPWLKWLESRAPALAALAAEGSEGGTFIHLMVKFRNLVHSETFHGRTLQTPEVEVYGLYLPDSIEEKLIGYFESLGGAAVWGVCPGSGRNERGWFSAPVFLEVATLRLFGLLNRLMEQSVLAASTTPRARPCSPPGSIRVPELERRELWLLGLA